MFLYVCNKDKLPSMNVKSLVVAVVKGVEKILKILLLIIVAIDFYNVLKYTVLA